MGAKWSSENVMYVTTIGSEKEYLQYGLKGYFYSFSLTGSVVSVSVKFSTAEINMEYYKYITKVQHTNTAPQQSI